eukprot:2248575-Pyramimonas_sp.AAC.1
MYRNLHLHPRMLVDGFSKLGIGFYALKTHELLVKENAAGLGSGEIHHSKLKTRIALNAPGRGWNPEQEQDAKRVRLSPPRAQRHCHPSPYVARPPSKDQQRVRWPGMNRNERGPRGAI